MKIIKIKCILSSLLYLACTQYPIHGNGATPAEDKILLDTCYRICGHEALHCLLPENNPNPELLENLSDVYNQYIMEYNAQNGTNFPKQIAKVLQERFVEQFPKFRQNKPSCPSDKDLTLQLVHWTQEDDQHFREIIAQGKSPNWPQIIPLFPQKSPLQIRSRYYQLKTAPNGTSPNPLFLYIPN
ncbi:MAG: SANT/Myb domain-containing protein [Holosporaceae bacterium]|jgi:hypothetical protein|nr:SANT/Myb domain-containing protein [Holosporaceae bacterium]